MKRTLRDAQTEADAGLIGALNLTRASLAGPQPLYCALAAALEGGIARGILIAGQRLPPERHLAAALSISRTTVAQAYRELESRGLVRAYVGRGTFVSAVPDPDGAPFAWRGKVSAVALRSSGTLLRDLLREASDPTLLAVAAGMPALEGFPVEEFRSAFDRVLRRHAGAVWGHGPTDGQPCMREALARRHHTRPECNLIIAGAQQGLDLLSRCLIDPGDVVVMDRPGYLGAIYSFQEAGARIQGWDVTRCDLDELEDLLLRYRPKLIYTNPTFHNPTGWTMPLKVRREFLEMATRYRVPVVEDDTYRDLHFSTPPPPSLYSLDEHSIVIYLNSFSKALAPGLRLGWITAAEPIVEHLTVIKQRADPHLQNLVQFVVADMIESGAFDAHLRSVRAEHLRRSQAAAMAIQRFVPPEALRLTAVPTGGLYFWCRLGAGLTARALLAPATAAGVAFVPGDAFYADQAGMHELRLCFGTITPTHADEVARRLATSLDTARLPGPVYRAAVPGP